VHGEVCDLATHHREKEVPLNQDGVRVLQRPKAGSNWPRCYPCPSPPPPRTRPGSESLGIRAALVELSSPAALSRERRSARDLSKEIARLCSCSRVRPMLSGFNSEEAQCAAGDEVTLEVEGVVDG
jgi:hypothetical protein